MTTAETEFSYATHEVTNQPTPLDSYNLFGSDRALRDGVAREGAESAERDLTAFGELLGKPETIQLGFDANRILPELHTHDRYGFRIDEVRYQSAYHELMRIGVEAGVHAEPWRNPGRGAHVARLAKHFMLSQIESGVGCPLTMTFAAVPSLRHQPEVAETWVPRLLSDSYDPSFQPAGDKQGALMGMAMTEKQGGSDVRANTTRAVPVNAGGPGQPHLLTGHKWFCSAPMCDAFLTLAQTEAGLSCFLVPRWLPDKTRNRFYIQRLKDKLGNRSNASSEIEYRDTWAVMIGEEGRGVPTIIEMVNHTRLDCIAGSASLMRQALAQAIHHASQRSAFGKRLIEQPLMLRVLADLAIETEAATAVMLRLARAYDEGPDNAEARAFSRIGTAASKYWVCKRGPGMVYEALECLGGAGYVEESIMPRLFRESPLCSIWEGSGNVMCLDVLRAATKDPETVPAFFNEVEKARGGNTALDAHLDALKALVGDPSMGVEEARRLVQMMALALQAALLVQHAPTAVADAFCGSRLGGESGLTYGVLPRGVDAKAIVERAAPQG